MGQSIIQRCPCAKPIQENYYHEPHRWHPGVCDLADSKQRYREPYEREYAASPEAARALDVEVADEKPAESEASVGAYEERARHGWRPAANSNAKLGGEEEDEPASGHEAELGEAGEEDGRRFEDCHGDDGVMCPQEFVQEKDG